MGLIIIAELIHHIHHIVHIKRFDGRLGPHDLRVFFGGNAIVQFKQVIDVMVAVAKGLHNLRDPCGPRGLQNDIHSLPGDVMGRIKGLTLKKV